MPRRSSGRSSGGRSWSAPRPAASTPRPAPVQAPAPPPAPLRSAPVGGGLGSVVAEGMAFGGGSAIAHRAVDSILGPRTIRHESVAFSDPAPAPSPAAEATTMNTTGGSDACGVQSKAFQDCLNYHASDISKCQFYLDVLSECRKGSVDSILGPRTIRHESVAFSDPAPAPSSAAEATTMNTTGGSDACGVQSKAFQDCLNYHASDISKCQFYLDVLSECRKGSGAGLSV
ncbi:unnamed protein product [Fraxinus pennsylvanica]|uniref:CHCH domain-containing protein n=1 Tax=Fraxinus pennsylvanica TaxID=56036 RepID=A0AAD2A208_9LAMI|nr:unnamed protein product [Fraxinus pennsylvanica]